MLQHLGRGPLSFRVPVELLAGHAVRGFFDQELHHLAEIARLLENTALPLRTCAILDDVVKIVKLRQASQSLCMR